MTYLQIVWCVISIQFNGHYGCLKCKIKGTSSATAKGCVTTFPYKDAINAEPRTKESYQQNARAAVNGDVDFVEGIRGPSWLARLKYFDIINGNGIEYMHCVLLGVVKTLMKLCLSSSHSKEPYNVSSMLSEIDEDIKKIHLPDRVARAP